MTDPNWKNRTLWIADNLNIMRGMNSETVDLIYLDPPFNSNEDYGAYGAEFKNAWTPSDVDEAWHGAVAEQAPKVYAAIPAAGLTRDKSMKPYLIMLAVRLIEMRRLLKPTGSIYLHCNDRSDSYLRTMMDALFASKNFRNALTWKRATAPSNRERWGGITDTILFYSNGDNPTWNPLAAAEPKTAQQMKTLYPSTDEHGSYRSENITGPLHGTPGGESGAPWRGFDPTAHNRCWSVPSTGRYAQWIEDNKIPGYRDIEGVHARLDALDAAGMIIHPAERRKWPGLKRYAAADQGNLPQSLILEPIGFTNYNKTKEYLGYPTQKPFALLERIIKASSNPGDIVLDPFCGCATALVAAERLGRQWVGIDLSELAEEVVLYRLREEEKPLLVEDIHCRKGIPKRKRKDIPKRKRTGCRKARRRAFKLKLYGAQMGECNGCLMPFLPRDMTVDHIVPKVRKGTNRRDNLQLLCFTCNQIKGKGSQEDLDAELKRRGTLP